MQGVIYHDEAFEKAWSELVARITVLCEKAVVQRDAAWYEARRRTIGGSEVYKLMGLPGKDTPYMLAKQKIEGNPKEIDLKTSFREMTTAPYLPYESVETMFSSGFQTLVFHKMHTAMSCGLAMHWGGVFEDVINEYMKITYGMRISCENLFYNPPGPFSYSPDGVTMLPGPDGKATPTLLEYKCPFTRVPGSTIPAEYVAQMCAGMELLNLSQTLYTEAVFRLCPWEHLDASTVCRLDLRSTMRYQTNAPLACGFFGIYAKPGTLEEPSFLCLGSSSVDDITAMFSMIAAGVLWVWYSPVCPDVSNAKEFLKESLEKFKTFCGGDHDAVGIMPWKLFSVTSKIVNRHPGYLEPWRDAGEKILSIIKRCMDSPRPLDRLAAETCMLSSESESE